MREGDLDTADVHDGLVETNHEAVGLVLQRLDASIQLHCGGESAPPLIHGSVDQSPAVQIFGKSTGRKFIRVIQQGCDSDGSVIDRLFLQLKTRETRSTALVPIARTSL